MKKKKILITGSYGQLGYRINKDLGDDFDLVLTDSDTMDITKSEEIDKVFTECQPDYVIHGAAYTQVDAAEEKKDLCYLINSEGTKNIAMACSKHDATLIYISTDFVFDGQKKSPYTEDDQAKPLSVYGDSKYQGELAVKNFCQKYFILRVSWLFGELPPNYPGSNFVETMIRLGKERDELSVVDDQIGSPTYTKDLVQLFKTIIETESNDFGVYHFSGEDKCSWYDFAKKIFELEDIKINLKPIPSASYPQKAKRPSYSYLSKEKVNKTFGAKIRPWQEMLKDYLNV